MLSKKRALVVAAGVGSLLGTLAPPSAAADARLTRGGPEIRVRTAVGIFNHGVAVRVIFVFEGEAFAKNEGVSRFRFPRWPRRPGNENGKHQPSRSVHAEASFKVSPYGIGIGDG